MVMYAGVMAELGTNGQIFSEQGPRHPYTRKLLAATPRLHRRVSELEFIPGAPPDLLDPPRGCRLASDAHCPGEVPGRLRARSWWKRVTWWPAGKRRETPSTDAAMTESILRAEALVKDFPVHRRLRDLGRGAPAPVRAVDRVSFELGRGEILGLVGESGCGKTTTGRMIMKLLPATGGRIFVEGKEVTRLARDSEMAYRRGVQMVFQDPYASLDPRYRVREVLEEPLLIHKIGASRADRMTMIGAALEKVKMTPVGDFVDRNPHMLSRRPEAESGRCPRPDPVTPDRGSRSNRSP